MDVSRLHRVLKLLTVLQTGRSLNADQLAAECSVSRRTIYRDLAIIDRAGIPFYYDRSSRRYRLHPAGFMPPISLTLDEALALVLLGSELGRAGRLPLFQPARDAAAKIEASLPLGMRAALGALTQNVVVRPGPVARHHALHDTYRLVQRSIARRQPLDAVYISFHDRGQIRTRLEPYWLFFSERAWYVVGRSTRHKAVRTFKLGRFKSLSPAPGRYRIPADFSLEKHFGNAWRIIRGQKSYDVRLRFSPLVAPNVAEVNWHKTQQVRWNDDGTLDFAVTVDGLDEIVWWILGYGPEVEVLQPDELRCRLADMARRMLARYSTA